MMLEIKNGAYQALSTCNRSVPGCEEVSASNNVNANK